MSAVCAFSPRSTRSQRVESDAGAGVTGMVARARRHCAHRQRDQCRAAARVARRARCEARCARSAAARRCERGRSSMSRARRRHDVPSRPAIEGFLISSARADKRRQARAPCQPRSRREGSPRNTTLNRSWRPVRCSRSARHGAPTRSMAASRAPRQERAQRGVEQRKPDHLRRHDHRRAGRNTKNCAIHSTHAMLVARR